jgi:hypothetical protein
MAEIASAEEWYAAVAGLAGRAEALADPTATYVDTAFLVTLQNNRNQIIFGRRGTGKTHLLRRLRDELLARFDELRIVPAYVDGATLQGVVSPDSDPAAVALGLYVELLRRVVRELSLFIDGKLRPGLLGRVFSGARRGQLAQVRDAAGRLDRLLTGGKVRMLPMGEASAEYEDLDVAVSRRRLAAGVNAAATLSDPRSLGITLEASAEKDLGKSARQVVTHKMAGETYLPLAEVTGLIRRLLGTLGDASLAIMVDEWSALGDTDVQHRRQVLIQEVLHQPSPPCKSRVAVSNRRARAAWRVQPRSWREVLAAGRGPSPASRVANLMIDVNLGHIQVTQRHIDHGISTEVTKSQPMAAWRHARDGCYAACAAAPGGEWPGKGSDAIIWITAANTNISGTKNFSKIAVPRASPVAL